MRSSFFAQSNDTVRGKLLSSNFRLDPDPLGMLACASSALLYGIYCYMKESIISSHAVRKKRYGALLNGRLNESGCSISFL
jgi:hypothetical protein